MKRSAQVTIYLDPLLLVAAKERASRMQLSLSAAFVDALKESLLSTYRSEREQEILKAIERNFYALRRLDQRLALELAVLKEMTGLGMRSFFNHSTPIPEGAKAAALLSGKQRFHGYLDTLAKNLRKGETILSDIPLPEFDTTNKPMLPETESSAADIADSPKPASVPNQITKQRKAIPAATAPLPANTQKDNRDWELFGSRSKT